jgi:peptidyl-prolyl cis-trans isomerase C
MYHYLRSLITALLSSCILFCSAMPTAAAENAVSSKTSEKNITASTNSAANPNAGKVASVNGATITQTLFDVAMTPYQQQIASMGEGSVTSEQLTTIKTKVLENLIGTELLYQEAVKSGTKVEDKAVDDAIKEQKSQFADEEEFKNALKQYSLTESALKDQVKMGLTIQRFIEKKFTGNTTVSDEEAKKYYDENPSYFQEPEKVKASHIMIMVDSSADQAKKDEAKKKIEQVLQRLKAGTDFATLAREVSEDTYSKDNGGDLDYFYKGQMVQAFEDAAFSLEPGETSNVVETEYGYHIIKVTDKQAAKTITFDESKEEIRSGLKTNKVNADVNSFVAELRSKADVKIYLMQ